MAAPSTFTDFPNTTTNTLYNTTTSFEDVPTNVGVIVGGMVSGVIAIILVILVWVALRMRYPRNKGQDEENLRILSDAGLVYVATRLGAEWSLVAVSLGLKQAEIDQIKLDNPYNTHTQINTALQKWRDRQGDQTDDTLLQRLFTALETCDRTDLVEEMREKYSISDTVGNSTESTTVDGINLDEIKEFAKQFKIRRLSLGLTQTQVGQALSATEGPAYSQSAICRFEKLDITPKSAQKIKPVLERWMQEAEERYKNGIQNLTDFIGSEPSKKRKRRTSFTPQALEVLNNFFERNTHPSGAEMTELSDKLNYDRKVIRVWFCNKRQALKNTIKKLKQETP